MKNPKTSTNNLLGKTILVGMTFYTKDGKLVERKQLWGVIHSIYENTIVIKQQNGEEFSIPNDISAIETATPGEYRLQSTGEAVINPDYLSTWTIELNEN